MKFLLLCHIDIQESSREGNTKFIIKGITLEAKGPGELISKFTFGRHYGVFSEI